MTMLHQAISIQNVTAAENAGTAASLNVTLSAASEKTITVDYASSNAHMPLQVLTLLRLVLQHLLLQQVKHQNHFCDYITDDSYEMDETFDITLSNPSNATIAAATGTVTITDNDPAPTISINDVSTADENAASTNLVATLSAASGKTITVDFATSDGTATAQMITQQLWNTYICSWETTKNIPIAVLADAFDEPNETVTVTL